MKNLIIEALDAAFAVVESEIPKEKEQEKTVSILDVRPIDLPTFMESHGIPETAHFWRTDNGYDAWGDIVLSWEEIVPTTETDKLIFAIKRFDVVAFRHIYDKLTKSGYIRTPVDSKLLRPYLNTNMYDLYIEKDFDKIVEYYSLYFRKEEEHCTPTKTEMRTCE